LIRACSHVVFSNLAERFTQEREKYGVVFITQQLKVYIRWLYIVDMEGEGNMNRNVALIPTGEGWWKGCHYS